MLPDFCYIHVISVLQKPHNLSCKLNLISIPDVTNLYTHEWIYSTKWQILNYRAINTKWSFSRNITSGKERTWGLEIEEQQTEWKQDRWQGSEENARIKISFQFKCVIINNIVWIFMIEYSIWAVDFSLWLNLDSLSFNIVSCIHLAI